MTRAKQKAIEAYPLTTEDTIKYFSDEQKIEFVKQQIHRREGFIEGYEQAEKDTIEKAIEWLKANAADYAGHADDIELSFDLRMHEDFIPDFKKAMEE